MQAYIYDSITKEYLYNTLVQESPLEPGTWLLPNNSTLLQPTIELGKVPCFINNNWTLFTDHRNQWQVQLSNITFSKVDYIGDAKEGFQFITEFIYEDYQRDHDKYKVVEGEFKDVSDTEEYKAKKLAQAKEAKHQENSTKAEATRESQQFTITLESTELLFDTSRNTQQDLQTALSFLSAGVEKYDWIDNNGTLFSFTSAQQVAQVSTVFMEKANVYPKWAYYKSLIDSATTLEEVQAIVIDYTINLEENIDYNSLTIAELKAVADSRNIQYNSNIRKADLIALLEA